MKLVLVHGIGQQTTDRETLQAAWLRALRETLDRPAGWPADKVSAVETPFYGKLLDDMIRGLTEARNVAQGIDGETDEFATFAGKDLNDMALAMGATQRDIDTEARKVLAESGTTAVEQGLVDKAWIKAIARVIEKRSPLHGRLVFKVVKQAYVYIKRPHIASEIDALVRPALEGDEPMIVVSHSLGTVICYKLLREFEDNNKPRNAPLFVTLGSPLSIDAVKRSFAPPRKRPHAIQRWLNGADRNDFVALRNVLDHKTFGPGPVDNINVDNGADPHAIERYLRNRKIARAIGEAIG
jgi:pimeloyl-ACP methyl ester carboxylesterase